MPSLVTYCRVSSEEQALKDISIPAQRKALARWIEENDGTRMLQEFVDEGESAYAPADKRPGFCEMITYCRKNDVDLILVHKLDRFSRNREESILFKSLLRRHGVTVKSATENYDPETPQGFLYEGIIEVFNQFYSMNLATETIKGMRENAERGYFNGGRVPYAYRVTKVAAANGREHSILAPGPENEVAVVREIFDLAVTHNLGAQQIASELNRRKVPPPLGAYWTKSTLATMLNNRTYVGDRVWNQRGKTSGKYRRRNAADKWVVQENTHEGIVDREVFFKRKENAKKRGFNLSRSPRRPVTYLLGRMIKCGHCGNNFVGRRHTKTSAKTGETYDLYHYLCNGYLNMGTSVCPSLPIDRYWLEGKVLDEIRKVINTPERIARLEELVQEKIEARRKAYGDSPRRVRDRIAGIDQKIRRYFEAIGEGLEPAICRQKIAELEHDKARLEQEASILKEEDYYVRALEKNVAGVRKLAATFKDGFQVRPFAIQRQVVLHFVDKIEVVDREEVRLTLRVPFDNNGLELLTDESGPGASGGPAAGVNQVGGKVCPDFSIRGELAPQDGLEPPA